MKSSCHIVDVFGAEPFTGNPVAVVTGGGDLSVDEMLRITRWFNLSETSFLLPSEDDRADYRVRIFTPDRELPFAGHPTLGTCHAWREAGGSPKNPGIIVQQCNAGLIDIAHVDGRLAFAAPPLIRSGPVEPEKIEEVAAFLKIAPADIVEAQWVDNGPGWIGVMLKSADAVLALNPRRDYPSRIDVGVVGPHPAGTGADYEIRTFFTDHNRTIVEDPITGSFNASVAQWLYGSGRIDRPYIAAQGTRIGRKGRVHVHRDQEGKIWIAGDTRTSVSGAFVTPSAL